MLRDCGFICNHVASFVFFGLRKYDVPQHQIRTNQRCQKTQLTKFKVNIIKCSVQNTKTAQI